MSRTWIYDENAFLFRLEPGPPVKLPQIRETAYSARHRYSYLISIPSSSVFIRHHSRLAAPLFLFCQHSSHSTQPGPFYLYLSIHVGVYTCPSLCSYGEGPTFGERGADLSIDLTKPHRCSWVYAANLRRQILSGACSCLCSWSPVESCAYLLTLLKDSWAEWCLTCNCLCLS